MNELSLTNHEVRMTFERLIRGWFGRCTGDYNQFIRALLEGNLEDMNGYMEFTGGQCHGECKKINVA